MYVYNTINESDRKPTRERGRDLIKFSSNNLIPYYLKNLRRLDLSDTHLRLADLEGSNLRADNFRAANFRGSDLRRADLEGSYLVKSYLRGAVNLPISLDEAKARVAYTYSLTLV